MLHDGVDVSHTNSALRIVLRKRLPFVYPPFLMALKVLTLLFTLLGTTSAFVYFKQDGYNESNFFVDPSFTEPGMLNIRLNSALGVFGVVKIAGTMFHNGKKPMDDPKLDVVFRNKVGEWSYALHVNMSSERAARITLGTGREMDPQRFFIDRGSDFVLHFRFQNSVVQIFLNYVSVAEAPIEKPFGANMIDHIAILGDVALKEVNYGRGNPLRSEMDIFGGTYVNLPMLKEGRIVITGIVFDDIRIDLYNEDSNSKTIMFHFNARFKEKKVIRNDLMGGLWGSEERTGGFPFAKDEGLTEITLHVLSSGIKCFVNGVHFVDYIPRTVSPPNTLLDFMRNLHVEGIHLYNVLWS
uniref:Galectin n=1 Tax=Steinernema glaseri TaxID=37863 RepID=A0A1I8A304_9BILA